MIMIENPFITYGYESAAYFCDRKAETRELVTMLTNGNHAALISPRRMGETGLIHHCFAQKEIQDRYYTFLSLFFGEIYYHFYHYHVNLLYIKQLDSGNKGGGSGIILPLPPLL